MSYGVHEVHLGVVKLFAKFCFLMFLAYLYLLSQHYSLKDKNRPLYVTIHVSEADILVVYGRSSC